MTVSYMVTIGGDRNNWSVLGAEDGRTWDEVLQRIASELGSIGSVTVMHDRSKGETFRVYADSDGCAERALGETEGSIISAVDAMAHHDEGLAWAIHGTVDGWSNLTIDDGCIE